MKLYEELLWRGLIKDVSNEELSRKMLNEQSVRFYCGFDPTAESLTVGHLVQIVRMMLLRKHKHEPIVLIGGATGLIGDPRETGERKMLTLEESLKNAEKIKAQIEKIIGVDEVIYVNNYDWIKDIDTISFLRDYGKHFNVNYMLAKDTVQRRLDIGISYTEFSYMIIQAIDFLHLFENYRCKMQFGGSDQWGNITAGLELIRKLKSTNEEAVGLSSHLLLKADGNKFGKSESGVLWLDEELTNAYEIYQYFLNTSDGEVIQYLKFLTLLEPKEIIKLENELTAKPELRSAQKKLASEVVKMLHGEKALEEAIDVSQALFFGEFNALSEKAFKILASSIESIELKEETALVDLLVLTKLAQSKREAREFINNQAIAVNDQKETDVLATVSKDRTYYNRYVVIKRGKKKYALAQFV
ncbi:MAG: tyrosine--tRNA ligase [Acholeplasmataceae bacterium]